MDVLLPALAWYLATTVIALPALPIARRLLGNLPDGGTAFVRPIGLLATAYLAWAGGLVGLVPNSAGGALVVTIAWLALGAWMVRSDRTGFKDWFERQRLRVTAYELLYAIAFGGWVVVRAANPDIQSAGGEKWMEMAFLNAILQSPDVPPRDPWMSGETISYYYFGYFMSALLVRLSLVSPWLAFNLVIPTTFAMTLVAAAGVGSNLAGLTPGVAGRWQAATALLAALLVAVAGNLSGALELGYLQGWGGPAFWNTLNVRNLTLRDLHPEAGTGAALAPDGSDLGCGADEVGYGRGGWIPGRFIWWWRGSRIIHDQCGEIIHEFPFFSFMLGDVHPHVMGLPFLIMVAGLALAVANGGIDRPKGRWWPPGRTWALGLAVGALGFLNAWDLPIGGALVVAGYAMAVWRAPPQPGLDRLTAWTGESKGRRWGVEVLAFAVTLAILALALYAPFYAALQSQVQGIGRVEIRSRIGQWVVHMGGVVFFAGTVAAYGGLRLMALRREKGLGVASAAVGAAGLALVAGGAVRGHWVAAGLAFLATVCVVAALEVTGSQAADRVPLAFALFVGACGFALPWALEYIFLRDLFNSRMNSIFKFYYQAWVLLSLTGAYGLALIARSRPLARWLWISPAAVLVAASLVFTVAATRTRVTEKGPMALTLDGLAWWSGAYAADRAAAEFLLAAAPDAPIIMEATGGSYSHRGRISMATGFPTVLGWEFHEVQWGRDGDAVRERADDVRAAYTGNQETLSRTLAKYGVRYFVVGHVERAEYNITSADMARYGRVLVPVFEHGETVIFEVP